MLAQCKLNQDTSFESYSDDTSSMQAMDEDLLSPLLQMDHTLHHTAIASNDNTNESV